MVFKRHADTFFILVFSLIPLALHFPYRVNIFLSWEGAYRLYLGQHPYRDFGLPMGFGYWLLPALFFKIFGPNMLSLVKAQVILNICGGLAFRGILKRLDVSPGVRLAAVLTFCLSYILINFWPWYNNTDIIYGIVGLYFLMVAYSERSLSRGAGALAGSALFLFLSFFTKQDGGFLMVAVGLAIVVYEAVFGREWARCGIFLGSFALVAVLFLEPLRGTAFGYWFNHGQPPHTARLSPRDILGEFLEFSQWIKFYLLLIILIVVWKARRGSFWNNQREMVFLLVTLGMLGTAAIFQVTSYTPPDNNIFFHAFAIAYILDGLASLMSWDASRYAWLLLAGVLLWWSGSYFKYLNRLFPQPVAVAMGGENVINRHTYMINTDTAHIEDEGTWTEVPGMPAFHKIKMPPSTVAGIGRLQGLAAFGLGKHVLNMCELTPLTRELGFNEDKGPMEPLWYHLGVCMFNREADTVCARISRQEYDGVLFEYVPSLNNFYPFRVRDSLLTNYNLVDSFLAPRRPTNGFVEVFVRRK
jgi:hypothetical protein